eukprot:scaffold113258_cov66-Phaeocystis_antarctica.AAC.1
MTALVAATGGLTLLSRPAPALVASTRQHNKAASTPTPGRTKASAPPGARSRPGTGMRLSVAGAEPVHAGPVPKKMQRAKTWSFEIENVFRYVHSMHCTCTAHALYMHSSSTASTARCASCSPSGHTPHKHRTCTAHALHVAGGGLQRPAGAASAGPARARGVAVVPPHQEAADQAELERRLGAALLPRENPSPIPNPSLSLTLTRIPTLTLTLTLRCCSTTERGRSAGPRTSQRSSSTPTNSALLPRSRRGLGTVHTHPPVSKVIFSHSKPKCYKCMRRNPDVPTSAAGRRLN